MEKGNRFWWIKRSIKQPLIIINFMDYRLIGNTGIRVSSLALGTDNFADPTPEKESSKILESAIDAGINLIDLVMFTLMEKAKKLLVEH